MSLPLLYLIIRCDEAIIFIMEKCGRREGREEGEEGEISEKVNPVIKNEVALWLPQVHTHP